MVALGNVADFQTQFSGFFWWASWFDSNSNLKADASDIEGWWRINGCDLREPYDPTTKSLLVEAGEYGVGGRSAMVEAMLDFLRARSGLRIESIGDWRGGEMSSGDGDRG